MLNYKQGDLIEAFENGEINVLLHQENCEGLSYFAGFAKVLHNKYPGLTKIHIENYQKYLSSDGKLYQCNQIFSFPLFYKIPNKEQWIINLYSQLFRGSPSKKYMLGHCYIDYEPQSRDTVKLFIGDHDAYRFPDKKESDDDFASYYGLEYKLFDTFENRCYALRQCLKELTGLAKDKKIGLPLIASGLAACKKRKKELTDLEYFKRYIAPIVEEELKDLDVTVYYL